MTFDPPAAAGDPAAAETYPTLLEVWRRGTAQHLSLVEAAMNSASNGITIAALAPDGSAPLVYVNAAFCDMTGYSPQEVIGRDCSFLQKRRAEPKAVRTIRQAIDRRERVTVRIVNHRKSGAAFWNELTIAPIVSDDGTTTHFIGVQRDVTLQEEQLAALQDLNAQLARQTDALRLSNASLDAFGAAVSHDLRAPLALIRTFAEIAARPDGDEASRTTCLRYIREAAGRMDGMIAALLQLARVSSGGLSRQAIDLSEMARTAVRLLELQHPHRKVDVHVQPGMRALGDPTLLSCVLDNLLSNAWKYTGRTATPRVRVGRVDEDACGASHSIFFVEDNGAGFASRGPASDFQLFRRHHTESEFPGTGVGLASVKHILARHGGELWAESAPGLGATFFFSLPRQALPEAGSHVPPAPPGGPSHPSIQ